MSTINIHLVLTFLFTYRGYSYELYLYIQQKNKQKSILLLSARENERNFHIVSFYVQEIESIYHLFQQR